MRSLKNLLFVLSTGYIFVYFSEHLFWARMRLDDSLAGWLGAWIAYSLMAYLFLGLVATFRVKGIWALFLAGAVFGWLAEGVVVQTTYDMLPLSISFTALAWHALLTVWIGWYAVQRALLAASIWPSIGLASLLGLLHGFWAINWWVEPDGGISSIAEFALFMFTTTALVILAYGLANWSSATPMRWNRWPLAAVVLLFVAYFLLVAAPAAPIALLVLPLLLGLAYWGLRRNRMAQPEGSLLDGLNGPIRWRNYLGLFCLPAASVAIYALALALGLRAPTSWLLYLITTPLGFILFALSLAKLRATARPSRTV